MMDLELLKRNDEKKMAIYCGEVGVKDCLSCGGKRSMVHATEAEKVYGGIEFRFRGYVCVECGGYLIEHVEI